MHHSRPTCLRVSQPTSRSPRSPSPRPSSPTPPHPALRLGVSTEFELEAVGEKLSISVGEKRWKFQLPRERPPAIDWGVGAQAGPAGAETGSAGLWIDLAVGK